MCRSFVNVYTPHCSDLDFHRLQLMTSPRSAAYDRRYIQLYRKRFPEYGTLPYGSTLMPLTMSAFRAKICRILVSKGYQIPFLTGKTYGRERDANSWGAWIRESASLRESARKMVSEGGIADQPALNSSLESFASGERSGTGQLFHLASIGRWFSIAKGAKSATS